MGLYGFYKQVVRGDAKLLGSIDFRKKMERFERIFLYSLLMILCKCEVSHGYLFLMIYDSRWIGPLEMGNRFSRIQRTKKEMTLY